jgi:hypothetical protein
MSGRVSNATGRPRRKLRFSLKALMVGIALCAAPMAVWRLYVMSYQAELRTITRIRALGEYKGQVYTEPRGQYLFRQLFGDRLSQRAVSVHLFSEEVDDGWIKEYLSGLRHVEILNINSPNVTDEGLSHLVDLKRLQRLCLVRSRVTERGVEELRRAIPGLKIIDRRP